MGFSNYFAAQVLDQYYPDTVTMSLHTADPGKTGASELTGGGYSRQTVTWNSASARARTSSAIVKFSNLTGTITHFGIWTGATFISGGQLEDSHTLTSSDFTLKVGDVAVLIGDYQR